MKIIKRIQKSIKAMAAVIRARDAVAYSVYVPPIVGEFQSHPIFIHDTYVHAYSAVSPYTPGIIVKENGSIVVNHAFQDLPDNIRNAFFMHELGHLKHGHKPSNPIDEALYILGQGPLLQKEYEADKYALEQGVDIIPALELFLEFDEVAKKPLYKRIIRLKSIKL